MVIGCDLLMSTISRDDREAATVSAVTPQGTSSLEGHHCSSQDSHLGLKDREREKEKGAVTKTRAIQKTY